MSAVDFEAWAAPSLDLTLGGNTYSIPAPDVERAKKLLAAAVNFEVTFGLAAGPLPDGVAAILRTIGDDEHPALTAPVRAQMEANGLAVQSIDRATFYSTFHWATGPDYATAVCKALWQREDGTGGDAGPKD